MPDTLAFCDLASGAFSTGAHDHRFFTTYHYDDLNRLIRIDDPAAAWTFQSFTYEAIGNCLSSTDRRGVRTSFAWDRQLSPEDSAQATRFGREFQERPKPQEAVRGLS